MFLQETQNQGMKKLQIILKSIFITIDLDTAAMFTIAYGSNKI
jgi:hypothetical protein